MWYHPKYYKELRKLRNKSDQVISNKRQASSNKQQASSNKPQASGQASSNKR